MLKPLRKRRRFDQAGLVLKRLREHGVPAGPVILCLPRDHADLLNLTLPKLAESELPDIVKIRFFATRPPISKDTRSTSTGDAATKRNEENSGIDLPHRTAGISAFVPRLVVALPKSSYV